MYQELKESVSHGTGDYPFALYRIRNASHAIHTPSHWHQEMELIYVESGLLHLSIGDEHHQGRAGDLFLINPEEIHSMYFESLETDYVAVLFPVSFLRFLNMDGSGRDFLMPLEEQKVRFVHVLTDTGVYGAIAEDMRRLMRLNGERPQAYQLGTKACLLDILYLLFSENLTVRAAKRSEYATLCRDILSFLQENYGAEVSLSTTAARFHMSEKYFSRFFKQHFSVTYVDYVNQLRMEQAAVLLTHTDLPVTEIAMRCGFSSSSYFNKRFKAFMGVTPSAYRG